MKKTLIALLVGATSLAAVARPPLNTGDHVGGIRYYDSYKATDEREAVPGFFFSFIHGPNSTFAVYKTAEGKGRDLPVNINRHNEETGIVIKGSVLFKAGYNGEFERVLHAGDAIVIPACVPHSGIFGWDHNEETILVTTFAEKYNEYGPDDAPKIATEFKKKVENVKPGMAIAENDMCKKMKGTPKVTWSLADLPKPE
jgi:mannose-6-phosphate isomerase-like protein (cupin superfamily)